MSRFSRELRDFIQAFLAGQKISSFNDELEYKKMRTALAKAQVNKLNDPELRATEIAKNRALGGYYGQLGGYYGAAAKAAGQPQQPTGPLAPGAIPPAENPAPQAVPVEPTEPAKTSALDVGDIGDSALEDMQFAGDYGGDDTQFASRGGVIKGKRRAVSMQSFADGGMVDDDDSDEGDDDVDATAPTSSSDTSDYADEAAHDAAIEGLRHSQDYALGPRRALPGMGRAPMANAAPTAQIEQIEKMVDPKGSMSPDMRRMAALSAVQQFYTKQAHDFLASGDAAGATRAQQAGRAAASALMDHYKLVSNHWAAMTQEALRNGDWQGAATSAMNAYDAIPTGTKIKVVADKNTGKFSYEYTDAKTGKLMRKGLLSPQELGSAAARLQNAGGYEDWLASAAGYRQRIGAGGGQARAPKEPKGPKDPTANDMGNARTAVSEELDRKDDAGNPIYNFDTFGQKNIPEGDMDAMKTVAANVLARNPGLSQRDAAIIAGRLAMTTDYEAPGYKVEAAPSGGARITLDKELGGRTVDIDHNTMMQIATMRGSRTEQRRGAAAEGYTKEVTKRRAEQKVKSAEEKSAAPAKALFQKWQEDQAAMEDRYARRRAEETKTAKSEEPKPAKTAVDADEE